MLEGSMRSDEHFIFPIADGTVNLSGRDHEVRKSTSMRDQPVRSEELSVDFRGSSDRSTDEITDDGEARSDFWSIERNYIFRHHVEPRIHLHVPKEESFPIPLKYIDVTRTTHTTLDVLQESRIDDYWNIDVNRNISESWTGFTMFTILNERPPNRATLFVARYLVQNVESSSTEGKAAMGYRETGARQCEKVERQLIY